MLLLFSALAFMLTRLTVQWAMQRRRSIISSCEGLHLILPRNEERFSLGGAAHERLRWDSLAGVRAGERKTYWTKPLPGSVGLWALNALASFPGGLLSCCERMLGVFLSADRVAKRSSSRVSGHLRVVLRPRKPSRRNRPQPGMARDSVSRGRNADSGS
jgi:hypothetical protein